MNETIFKKIVKLQLQKMLLSKVLGSDVVPSEDEAKALEKYITFGITKLKTELAKVDSDELDKYSETMDLQKLLTPEDEKEITHAVVGREMLIKDFIEYWTPRSDEKTEE